MPLYTYIVSFNNSTYVGQGRHSNFRGFVTAWCSEMPDNALNGFSASLKKQLAEKAYHGEFAPVPNRINVWKKVIDLGGKEFVIHAVETKQ
jgi:hypothetical protein